MSAITAKASRKMKKYAVLTREPRCFLGSFDLSWEQRKAIDIADYSKGNGYSKGDLTDAGTPIILYGRLYTKYQFAISEVDTFAVPRNGAVYSQGNEVIVPASGETAEDIARASAVEKSGVLLGGDLNILRPFDFINPLFLALAISNGEPQKELAKKAQGKSVVHIHNTDIQEVTIAYPSRTEQDRIVSVFRQLDNLITLHQRKCALLFSPFQSFISMMFTTSTFSWEQRKFSELVQIERGGSPRPIDDFITDAPNGLNWVKIGDAPTQGNYITKTAEKIRPEGLSKTREVHPGDLILSNSMSFGKPYIMGIDGCIHDGWLLIRNTYGVFDLTFLCHLLGTPQMLSQYRSLAAGSTVNNLNKELVENTVVTIPSITEQRVLGDYLEQLDNLITLHQRKFEKLTNVKKSMLEKMFPQNGSSYPEIRFKGFTDPWEQRKFEEIAVRSSVICSDDTLPRVEYEDIVSGTGRLNKDIYAKQSSKSGIVFHQGDVLYGKLRPYLQNWLLPTFDGLAVGDFWVLQPQNADSSFLYRLIQSRQFDEVANQSTGTKMPRADWKLVSKTVFSIPSNISEQAAIGTYFTALDSLITLHQRQLFCIQPRIFL